MVMDADVLQRVLRVIVSNASKVKDSRMPILDTSGEAA